jgi:mRNA-degrading endonuclease toxin of MazEF toxin-antitoxin module
MSKKFQEWFLLKSKLDSVSHEAAPLFKEAEIWWCSFGENIGSEENGKSEEFLRPVIIYKKFDRFTFLGIPLTSQIKEGSWYVSIQFQRQNQTVIINQIRSLSVRRLRYYMGIIDETDYIKVKTGFSRLYL